MKKAILCVVAGLLLVGCSDGNGGSNGPACDPAVDQERCSGPSVREVCSDATSAWSELETCAKGYLCADADLPGITVCENELIKACADSAGCVDGNCIGGVCVPFHCFDGVMSSDETGIDCGGVCPSGCGLGGLCNGGSDCASKCCSLDFLCEPDSDSDTVCDSADTCPGRDDTLFVEGTCDQCLQPHSMGENCDICDDGWSGPNCANGDVELAIYAGGHPVKLTSNIGEASVIAANTAAFCDPELSRDCDLADPAHNEQTVTFIHLRNYGVGTLEVSEFSVDNDEYFEIRSQAGLAVPANYLDPQFILSPEGEEGDSHYFDLVMFRPPEGTTPSTVIMIRSNSTLNGGDLVKIAVKGEGLLPDISAPSAVEFGAVSKGESKTKSINILNTGTGPLKISGFSLSGHPSFSLAWGPPHLDQAMEWTASPENSAGEVILDTPVVISIGMSASATVKFAPEGPEPASANLLLFTNDPNAQTGTFTKLTGNTYSPCLTINPKVVDFGGKLVGNMTTMDVEVVSCGSMPLAIHSIGLALESSEDFALDLGGLPGLALGTTEVVLDETPCQLDSACIAGLSCLEGSCAVMLGVNETANFQVAFVPDEINPLDGDGQPIVDEAWINLTTSSFVSEMQIGVLGWGVGGE